MRRRIAPLAVCAIALIALAAPAHAQDSEDFGVWLGVTATGKLPPSLNNDEGRWRLWTDIQIRFGDDASRFSQGIVRPGIGYAVNRAWTLWVGYAYVRTEQPYAPIPTTENRIWEQASWNGSICSVTLSSRTRLEQRFVSTGSDTGWRLRELVKAVQPLGSKSTWSLVVYDEFFVNLNSTNYGAIAGPDRNRFFIGPGVRVSPRVVLEVGYLNQYIYRANGPDKKDQLLAVNVLWSF